jgi:hypothetical protein
VKWFWEFFYYNKRANDKQQEDLKIVLKEHGIEVNAGGLSQADFQGIIENSARLGSIKKDFKDRFRDIFKDMNSTGLVVLHGPIQAREAHLTRKKTKYKRGKKLYYHTDLTYYFEGLSYTLLSGDTSLHQIEYPPYLMNQLPHVRIFQVPHHGAKRNWDNVYLQSNGLEDCQMIINYGWGNGYGHPGHQIIEDLRNSHDWKKRANTQFKDFNYRLTVYVVRK